VSAVTDWIIASSAAVSTAFVGVASVLGVRQLKEAHTGNRLVALARVTDTLIASPIMEARLWVSANASTLETARLADLAETDRTRVEAVWRAYDRVGLLFDHDLIIDERPVLDMWGYSIERTYEILQHLLAERRNSGGNPDFAHNFSTLYDRVLRSVGQRLSLRP
jgi:hypothetical protein